MYLQANCNKSDFAADFIWAISSRFAYFQGYLAALLDARRQGVSIGGYFAWSLLDNFEWTLGYSTNCALRSNSPLQ